jgi:hypothetical protein
LVQHHPAYAPRILILGLGGGAMVNYLRFIYPKAVIDVVELVRPSLSFPLSS